MSAAPADLHFWFDPVCPFAWMTSTWVRQVQAQRDYTVDWRFISLRLINRAVDYDTHFPPDYEAGHTAGLKLLRVAASVRAEHGPEAVGPLYAALGAHLWETAPTESGLAEAARRSSPAMAATVLTEAGLPDRHAAALDDESFDAEISAETDEALALTGKDVGTPILQFRGGLAFFGPVISRRPSDDEAVELWDHVIGLARFPGFAELKRSLRERPQLPALGVPTSEVGLTEDWHGGSRRLKK